MRPRASRRRRRGPGAWRIAAVAAVAAALLARAPVAAAPDGLVSNGVLSLSLEQAALLALEHNRDLAVQQFGPAIAGAFEQIERGALDSELFARFDYGEETGSETSRSTGEKFSVEAKDREIAAGVRRRLSTGTALEAAVEQSRSVSDRAPEQQEARLGLSLTQSLLRGFGPSVNLAAVRQAELGTRASRYELRGFTEALLADCETAYWRYVLSREEIAIFEESLQVARQQRDEILKSIEVGALAPNDAAAPKAEVARREQALIVARGMLEERRLRLLKLIYPGALERNVLPLEATTAPHADAPAITNALERLALAERMRPDLQEARLRLEQDRLNVVVTRNGVLPRLDLFVVLGKTGFADSFRDSFRDIDGDGYDVTAGVRFSHLLGNRAADGRRAAALAERDQGNVAVRNLGDIVRLDVRLAINACERLRQQISASAVTRELQEQTLSAERERFAVGSSTSLLVAQAQRDLLVSRIAEIEAVVNYRIALVDLYRAEGSLLERRGIAVEVAE